MIQVNGSSAAIEHGYHRYSGSRIPWYVRLIWLLYWVFAVYYMITYLFPAMRLELLTPQ